MIAKNTLCLWYDGHEEDRRGEDRSGSSGVTARL
jgi:hypothetical protein